MTFEVDIRHIRRYIVEPDSSEYAEVYDEEHWHASHEISQYQVFIRCGDKRKQLLGPHDDISQAALDLCCDRVAKEIAAYLTQNCRVGDVDWEAQA